MEELDLSRKLLNYYEKFKNELKNKDEILKSSRGFFKSVFLEGDVYCKYGSSKKLDWYFKNEKFLFSLKNNIFYFDKFLIYSKIREKTYKRVYYSHYSSLRKHDHGIFGGELFFSEVLDRFWSIDKLITKKLEIKKNKENFKIEEELRLEEEKRLKELKISQTNVLSELDKDGNGIIDVIEGGDDFMKLFRKHQSVIKEFDKEYINHLVKISNYLKTKRSNIQEIFLEIKKTKFRFQFQLNEYVGLLKNQIHTYEVVLFHSLSLITSIVEDDLITVNEIYEEFDKLKMFKTDHEKEVSQKLSDIGDGLSTLMYSINSMERNIVSGLNTLSYVTQDGFSDLNNSLSTELQSINSSIDTNNLLTGISTYQLYKINKQTKGLIE